MNQFAITLNATVLLALVALTNTKFASLTNSAITNKQAHHTRN